MKNQNFNIPCENCITLSVCMNKMGEGEYLIFSRVNKCRIIAEYLTDHPEWIQVELRAHLLGIMKKSRFCHSEYEYRYIIGEVNYLLGANGRN